MYVCTVCMNVCIHVYIYMIAIIYLYSPNNCYDGMFAVKVYSHRKVRLVAEQLILTL